MTNDVHALVSLLQKDVLRLHLLKLVHDVSGPECWLAAGFVRDAVWGQLHGFQPTKPQGDIDVVWFDTQRTDQEHDTLLEQALRLKAPEYLWSVKNQARMHLRNGDAPYQSVADAMRHWPETATAVAVRLGPTGCIEVNAPFGLDDLFQLRLKPGPCFLHAKHVMFEERVRKKNWLQRFPLLHVEGKDV